MNRRGFLAIFAGAGICRAKTGTGKPDPVTDFAFEDVVLTQYKFLDWPNLDQFEIVIQGKTDAVCERLKIADLHENATQIVRARRTGTPLWPGELGEPGNG